MQLRDKEACYFLILVQKEYKAIKIRSEFLTIQ